MFLKFKIFVLFVVFSVTICGCKQAPQEYKIEGNALGTTYHITYLNSSEIDSFSTKVDSIIFAVNHGLSTYQTNSLITAFNTNTNTIWNDPEEAKHFLNDMQHFVEMISLSKSISNETAGAFDPSAAQLFSIYDKAKKEQVLMDEQEVASALSHQGMHKIVYDNNGFPNKKDSLLTLNFNAIAKGYLVDLIAGYIETKGLTNYLVEVGGEMRVKGKNFNKESWSVGINVPLTEANPKYYFKVLELENVAVATSGNYQNFYTVDGEIIGHTLDPRSGLPVLTNLKSATILSDYCAVADAYATASMVLGLKEALKIIEQDSALSAYFIYEEDDELKGIFVD